MLRMKALAQRWLERRRCSATMLGAALLLLTLTDARAFAQNESISTIAVQGLSFGNFVPGASMTVQPTSSTAARWRIVVLSPGGSTKNATVDIRFTLPPALTTTGGSMPISFGMSMARIVNADGTSTTFDPAAGLTFQVKTEASVFLGGTASAPGGQRAGPYSGSIIMTATMR
jgi:hypothetical protein